LLCTGRAGPDDLDLLLLRSQLNGPLCMYQGTYLATPMQHTWRLYSGPVFRRTDEATLKHAKDEPYS